MSSLLAPGLCAPPATPTPKEAHSFWKPSLKTNSKPYFESHFSGFVCWVSLYSLRIRSNWEIAICASYRFSRISSPPVNFQHNSYTSIREIAQITQTLCFHMVIDPPRTLMFDRDRAIPQKKQSTWYIVRNVGHACRCIGWSALQIPDGGLPLLMIVTHLWSDGPIKQVGKACTQMSVQLIYNPTIRSNSPHIKHTSNNGKASC